MEKSVDITRKKASIFQRILAGAIDLFIVIFLALGIAATALGSDFIDQYELEYIHSFLTVAIIISLLYYFLKDSVQGISIGRWIIGIRVLYLVNEGKPKALNFFLRNLWLIIWPIELIILLISSDKRRIGDKLTETDVFEQEVKSKLLVRILSFLIIPIGFFIFAELYGSAMMKNSEAYDFAIESIEANQDIIGKIGTIENFSSVSGSISMDEEGAYATFVFNLKGKEEELKVEIILERNSNKEWYVKELK